MQELWRTSPSRTLAVLLTLTCAGCQPSAAPPLRPDLPPPPALFGQEVPVPNPGRGQDARLFAAQTRRALLESNERLRDDAAFYHDVQRDFGADAPAAPAP